MSTNIARVLCVDDQIAGQLSQVIARGYGEPIEVLTAEDIRTARTILQQSAGAIDVMILDVFVSDGADGPDLYREFGSLVPTIFISGHPESEFAPSVEGMAPLAYHQKPPDTAVLIRQIRQGVMLKRGRIVATDLEAEQNLRFPLRKASVVSLRFHVREIHHDEAHGPSETLWDYAPLSLAFNKVETAIEWHGGRIQHLWGLTLSTIFPAVGNDSAHFENAMAALRDAHQSVAEAFFSQDLYIARFSAGIVPGTVVRDTYGGGNPGISAIVGRMAESAGRLSDLGSTGEVATIHEWLDEEHRKIFFGDESEPRPTTSASTSVRLTGIREPVKVVFAALG